MDRNKAAVEIFDKLAGLYQEKFMNVEAYAASLNLFCDNIPAPTADILELACGPGNVTKYLLTRRPDLKILATDLAPNMLALARQNNPGAEFALLDCKNLDSVTQRYDGIICSFCLPYLSREEVLDMIQSASQRLRPGGLLYLSTMEGDYRKSGLKKGSTGDEIYMYYHEGGYLVAALEQNKLRVLDLRRQDYPESDGSTSMDLIVIAEKV